MTPFVKGHGLGNDYIVIKGDDLPTPLTAKQTVRICDRNWGVGSDGILLKVPAWAGADFGLRIFNPDGSEAEKSGNGLRIFSRYLWDQQLVTSPNFTVETPGGHVQVAIKDGGKLLTIAMGSVSFDSAKIPVAGPPREVLNEKIEVLYREFTYNAATIRKRY